MLRHFQPSTRWNRAAIPGSKPPNADAAFDPTDPSAPAIYGPERPLIAPQIFAVQLSHSGHSCEAQHSRRVVSHNAAKAPFCCVAPRSALRRSTFDDA